jgi:hypothetical protein
LRLIKALLDLTNDVLPLDLVRDVHRFSLVIGAAHLPEGQKDAQLLAKVSLDEPRLRSCSQMRAFVTLGSTMERRLNAASARSD